MPQPPSQTLVEIRDLLVQTNTKLDTLIAGQGGAAPELAEIRGELAQLRAMFHYRQWETGQPLDPPYPALPSWDDPVGPFPP